MSDESEKFSTRDVVFNYSESREINSTRTTQPIITGVKSLHVTCNVCNHEWTSREFGECRFFPAMSQIQIECPSCNKSENIAIRTLM